MDRPAADNGPIRERRPRDGRPDAERLTLLGDRKGVAHDRQRQRSIAPPPAPSIARATTSAASSEATAASTDPAPTPPSRCRRPGAGRRYLRACPPSRPGRSSPADSVSTHCTLFGGRVQLPLDRGQGEPDDGGVEHQDERPRQVPTSTHQRRPDSAVEVTSGRGQLEHGHRAGAAYEPTRRDRAARFDHLTLQVQEEEIQREAHSKGVDAPAARDQEASSRPPPGQQGQAEQAAQPSRRDRDLEAEQPGPLERAKAKRRPHPSISFCTDGVRGTARRVAREESSFLQRVFLWMFVGLAITAGSRRQSGHRTSCSPTSPRARGSSSG